jgi:hypothetical protein
MTFLNLQKRVFSYLNRVDSTGAAITTEILATDVINWINDRYREDLVPEYARANPKYFEQEAWMDSWVATGTVSATSTSTTLVATSAIFTESMVDGTVKNTTDSSSANIVGFTDTSTVTLDTTIGDTWDGDTIYVHNGVYGFDTDATDLMEVTYVGVKYLSTDDDYQRAEAKDQRDLFRNRKGRSKYDTFSKVAPVYTIETIDVAGVPKTGIRIFPFDWTSPLENAIYFKYVELPAELSADGDIPRLPLGFHKLLVFGATADGLRKLEKFNEANEFESQYQNGLRKMLRVKQNESTNRTVRFKGHRYKVN